MNFPLHFIIHIIMKFHYEIERVRVYIYMYMQYVQQNGSKMMIILG